MSTSKEQRHIDSCGRLAAVINDLGFECQMIDLLTWCSEANVILDADTKTPLAALGRLA